MRSSLILPLLVLALHFAAIGVSAQTYFLPPRAPDMLNPGYYYQTQNGTIYGPNYFVRPCFQPHQGMILAPGACPPSGGCGSGSSQGPAGAQSGGAAFPSHLFSRSPRDFFMIETDPRSRPTTYGY